MLATAAPTTAPCRSCGTTGGAPRRPGGRPLRNHGCCRACYDRARLPGLAAAGPGALPPAVARHTCATCGAPFLAYRRHHRRFCSPRCARRAQFPARPLPPPGLVIRAAALRLDPADLAARAAVAGVRLAREAERAALAGYRWAMQHPEQFSQAALMRLFPGPEGRAVSYFAPFAGEEAVA